MDAPVPASALIHSATLVIAGIYIMYKFKNLYNYYLNITLCISFLCILSALIFSFVACFQTDLKKILAYSTISQCGFIIVIMLISNDFNFFFYTIMHGIIKSILFMMCGLFFIVNRHSQDIRNFSNLKYLIFYHFSIFLLILSALPLSFFYDFKHSIFIKLNYTYYNIYKNFFLTSIVLFSISSFCYSFILIYKISTFKDTTNRNFCNIYNDLTRNGWLMSLFIIILTHIYLFLFLPFNYLLLNNSWELFNYVMLDYKNYNSLNVLSLYTLIIFEYFFFLSVQKKKVNYLVFLM